jgi:ribosome-associated protein
MTEELNITGTPGISAGELRFITSRSSGPGGQNVNKVESRVTLLFDLEGTDALTDSQKEMVRGKLSTRINKMGVLRVVAQKHRTQAANRKLAIERFSELMTHALESQKPRKPTRKSKAAAERRLEQKHRRSRLKQNRRDSFDRSSDW